MQPGVHFFPMLMVFIAVVVLGVLILITLWEIARRQREILEYLRVIRNDTDELTRPFPPQPPAP